MYIKNIDHNSILIAFTFVLVFDNLYMNPLITMYLNTVKSAYKVPGYNELPFIRY